MRGFVAGNLLDAQSFGDRFVDRLTGIERARRILEDHLHLAPVAAQRGVVVLEGRAAKPHLTFHGLLETEDRAGERRLPAAGLADERENLSGLDVEVDAVDGAGDRALPPREADVDVA